MHVNQNSNQSHHDEVIPVKIRRGRVQDEIFNRDDYFIDSNVNFRSGPQSRSGLQLTLWSWMSAFIDTLVLISLSCFTLVMFSFLMRTPARDIVRLFAVEPKITEIFAISFVFSFWVYMIVMRVFMGASLGEWSCQLRLGQPIQRIKPTYVLRVILRTSILLSTGVILLPILSLLFKRDLLGDITGIRVYSLT